MRNLSVAPRGPGQIKAVPSVGAAPNANGDKSISRKPPRLKSVNTRDYGKKPVVQSPNPFGPLGDI